MGKAEELIQGRTQPSFDGLKIGGEGCLTGEAKCIGLQHYKIVVGREGFSRTAEYSLWLGITPSEQWFQTKFREGRETYSEEEMCIDLEKENGSLQKPKRFGTVEKVTEIIN